MAFVSRLYVCRDLRASDIDHNLTNTEFIYNHFSHIGVIMLETYCFS